MLEHLPEFGRYKLSLADDDELAARIAERTGEKPNGKKQGVPLLSWTAQREQTATLTDVMVSVRQQILAGQLKKGKAPPRVSPAPRPRTALQRAEARRDLTRHRSIVATVLPKGEG